MSSTIKALFVAALTLSPASGAYALPSHFDGSIRAISSSELTEARFRGGGFHAGGFRGRGGFAGGGRHHWAGGGGRHWAGGGRYRYGYGWRRGYYGGGYGYGAAGVAAGVAAGAALGAAAASQGSSADYCASRYRSYDPGSGTYLGNDGLRHPCP